jgi:hypothetical protein
VTVLVAKVDDNLSSLQCSVPCLLQLTANPPVDLSPDRGYSFPRSSPVTRNSLPRRSKLLATFPMLR